MLHALIRMYYIDVLHLCKKMSLWLYDLHDYNKELHQQ